MENLRIHVWINGKVQGVFFRASTKDKAKKLGLNGYVKNLSDGKVEAIFEGEKEKLEKILQWCKKGPSSAIVKDVKVKKEESSGEFNDFSIVF